MQLSEIKDILSSLKDIAPILSGSIGAIATLLAVSVTSHFNLKIAKTNNAEHHRQRSDELKLEKLEELFFLFDKWQVNFSNIYLYHLRCYREKLTFQQALKAINNFNLLEPGDAQRDKTLLEIYFPSLQSAYSPVEDARKDIVPFLSDPHTNKLKTQDFEGAQITFEKACANFKLEISSLAQEIHTQQPIPKRRHTTFSINRSK